LTEEQSTCYFCHDLDIKLHQSSSNRSVAKERMSKHRDVMCAISFHCSRSWKKHERPCLLSKVVFKLLWSSM
jgi:hypothetical protein